MKLCRQRWVHLIAVLTALGLLSCDRADVIGPDESGLPRNPVAAGPLFSHDDGSYVLIKEETLPEPVQPSPSEGDGFWWRPLNAVVDSAWVRVRVHGGWTLSPNPEYRDNPAFHCDTTDCFPKAGWTIGPAGGAGLRVTLAYQRGETTPLAPGSGPGPELVYRQIDPLTVEALWNTSDPINFWVKRDGGEGGSWDGRWIPRYLYSGGPQVVTVTEVPIPVRVSAAKMFIQPGDMVTFTAEVDGTVDLSGGTPIINWSWSPGDTLPTPKQLYHYPVDACSGQLTCAYAPRYGQSGRMYVTASVEGRSAKNHSEIVWNGKTPELTVTCEPVPAVYRQVVRCMAGSSPAGATIESLSWYYKGESASVSKQGLTWDASLLTGDTLFASASVEGALKNAHQLLEVVACPDNSEGIANPELVRFRNDSQCMGIADVIAGLRDFVGTPQHDPADVEKCREFGENAHDRYYGGDYLWSEPFDRDDDGESDYGEAIRALGEVLLTARPFNETGQLWPTIVHEEAHLVTPLYPDSSYWDGEKRVPNPPHEDGRYADDWEVICKSGD